MDVASEQEQKQTSPYAAVVAGHASPSSKTVPRMAGRDQLFGQRGGGFTAWSRGKAVLDARSGVKDWTTHDIRRTVATGMADMSIMPHVIEQILNHQSGHKAGRRDLQ